MSDRRVRSTLEWPNDCMYTYKRARSYRVEAHCRYRVEWRFGVHHGLIVIHKPIGTAGSLPRYGLQIPYLHSKSVFSVSLDVHTSMYCLALPFPALPTVLHLQRLVSAKPEICSCTPALHSAVSDSSH